MKKIIAITIATVVFNLFSPLMPHVKAAAIEEQLLQSVISNNGISGISQVSDVLKFAKDLKQEDKKAILESLAQASLVKMQPASIMNVVATGDIKKVAQEVVSQKINQNITDSLSSYEKEMAILSLLLKGNNLLTPQASRENNSLTGAPQNYKQVLNMTATAYGPGVLDNGKWGNLTYMGGTVRKGVAAVDPKVIPMGSKLWIEGYGEAIAEDQGSAIKGNRIDLAFNDRQQALDYGIQNAKVYVLN